MNNSLANIKANMHALVITFLLFMATNLIFLANARKLTSTSYHNNTNSNGFFSVELIHRNSPPQDSCAGGRGRRSSFGSVSSHHKITLSSTHYDSNKIQTAIIPDGADYVMKIAVGTPPVEFTAVADTGSDLFWLQCAPCEGCIPQPSPLFDPTGSSTYHVLPCTSPVCNPNEPGLDNTGCAPVGGDDGGSSCTYGEMYGDGTQTNGVLNTETVSFPSSSGGFPSFIFGCGYSQQGYLGAQADGIVGLGGGPLSLVSQLSPSFNYKFSYCLTPSTSGVNSKLNFGVDVAGPGVVSTPFTKQDDAPTYYVLTLDSVTIGDNSTSIPVASDIIIDSGTTMTYLPSNVYDGIRAAMKDAIALTPVPDPEQSYDPCYEESDVNPPDVVFNFKGADVVLKAENTFRTLNGLTCMTMVPSDDPYIFGNIAQVNFQVGYDLKANQVSFAPADCTTI